MKKFLALAMIGLLSFAMCDTSQAQTGMSNNNKWVRFKYPVGNTENKAYLFPSFDYQVKKYDNDTTVVSVTQLETWVYMDSVQGASLFVLSPSDYLLAGAKLFLQLGKDTTNRTVYVKQGSYALDTVAVGNTNVKRQYIFNGTKFEVFK